MKQRFPSLVDSVSSPDHGDATPSIVRYEDKENRNLEDHALLMSRTGMTGDTVAPSACVIGGVIVYLVGD